MTAVPQKKSAKMIDIFHDLRHLTDRLTSFDDSIRRVELMSLDSVRNSLEHWVLSHETRKLKGQMQVLDYVLSACRIAMLIFLNRDAFRLRNRDIRQLMCQLKDLVLEKESRIIDKAPLQMQWGYYTWSMFIGGIHSLNKEDTTFFTKRIATSTRVWQAKGFGSWPETLNCIKRIGWANALQNAECEVFGKQVEKFIDSHWELAPELSAHTSLPNSRHY